MEGLKYIKDFSELRELDLSETGISDKGLGVYQELDETGGVVYRRHPSDRRRHRTPLWFKPFSCRWTCINTRVTDKALEHLKALRNLEWLELDMTKASDKSMRKLQKELPNCRISPLNPETFGGHNESAGQSRHGSSG